MCCEFNASRRRGLRPLSHSSSPSRPRLRPAENKQDKAASKDSVVVVFVFVVKQLYEQLPDWQQRREQEEEKEEEEKEKERS